MALAFDSSGPFKIAIGGTDIGCTSDDDAPSVEVVEFQHVARCTQSGDEPGEIFYRGRVALIDFTLVQWEITAEGSLMDSVIMQAPGGTTEGDAGTIGLTYIGGSNTFSLTIEPDIVDGVRRLYTFGRVYPRETPYRIFNLGNQETMIAIQLIAIRDASGDLYQVSIPGA